MIKVGSFAYLQDEKGKWFYKSIDFSSLRPKVKKEEQKDPIPFNIIDEIETEFKIDYEECIIDTTKEIATYLVSLSK